jgi:hypothetical protein
MIILLVLMKIRFFFTCHHPHDSLDFFHIIFFCMHIMVGNYENLRSEILWRKDMKKHKKVFEELLEYFIKLVVVEVALL